MIRNGAVMNSWLWGLGHSRLGLSRLGLSRLGLSRSLAKAILLAVSSVGLSGVGLSGIGLSYVGSFGVSQANAAQPSGKVRTTHGAWSIICDTPAGATSEQCVMMQNVVAEDRPEMGLSVVVLRTADNKAEILRVLAPLGVLLPNGLGLNVDGKDIGRAYFVRCFQDGCYAEVILEKPLLDTLKTGTSATFIVFQTPEEGIGIPVELKGFADGFAALP
ncbi:invasion associated locus B family protein [Mesorhizobium sp.]|uniref:invasion associated locus B family protein n=1 Tax=Mesorhizobium sp. TaxID=1871066 RepID=UPI000FE36775|nr:invasion associated locus B family protein [Mesorhizobium sp.]RWN58221.1 MAG: invasion associated locus B family protein [Mesorhizobium sp.]RWN79225.1 MAG: invasion associated locus B family protein [Mesorhizobium sp.]RWN84782.1 MAG: invasion associated locus B family protein [Mesorhizobium sp.]RWN92901.1 MAG: invasion associated locus B family protein [Mesorhizobium sp.]RWO17297.1 MAG: invasion associated locus B family protein [Mesorhizobium sp.]